MNKFLISFSVNKWAESRYNYSDLKDYIKPCECQLYSTI